MAGASLKNENTVEYWIYPFSTEITLSDLLSYVLCQSSDYIWQNECFKLVERELPVRHFYGRTDFGENSDDEWYVVHLLLLLTTKFPDVVIRAQDTDGEFLLIEAADFLPHWINKSSTNMQNRVFLHNGAVHVIPRKKDSSANFPDVIETAHQGAALVDSFPHLTVADSSFHLCIERKIGSIVDHLETKFHYAHCYLPAKVAYVLKEHPQLVSPAVEAFYTRDPIDLKYCREAKYFPHENIILRRVKFTRHLYAMLAQQKFNPDRRSTWKLPPPNDSSFKNHCLGLKLTCGFEILCRRQDKNKLVTNFSSNETTWDKFLASLSENGYFKTEVQGSKKYDELLQQGKWFYDEQFIQENSRNPGTIILSTLNSFNDKHLEEMRKECDGLLKEDDDSWLNVTPEMLDEIFKANSSFSNTFNSSKGFGTNLRNKTGSSGSALKKEISQKVNKFINSQGSYEGADLLAGSSSRSLPKADRTCNGSSMKNEILDLNLPGSSSDSSDMESYGSEKDGDEGSDVDEDELEEMKKWSDMMRNYMKQMDAELENTSLGQTFTAKKATEEKSDAQKQKSSRPNSIDLEDDNFTAVDIDKNLAKNLLNSYQSEAGVSGPASTLLHGLNLLPSKMQTNALDSDDDTEGSDIGG